MGREEQNAFRNFGSLRLGALLVGDKCQTQLPRPRSPTHGASSALGGSTTRNDLQFTGG